MTDRLRVGICRPGRNHPRRPRGRRRAHVATQPDQLTSELVRPQHEPHAAGLDSIDWHAGKTSGSWVLRQRDPATLTDRAYATGAVRPCARQHHTDRAIAALFGERGEQNIPGLMGCSGCGCHADAAGFHRQRGACGHHVDPVSLRDNAVVSRQHRESLPRREPSHQYLLAPRIVVLNDNKSCAAYIRESGQQFGDGVHVAHRRSHRYDWSCTHLLLSRTDVGAGFAIDRARRKDG